MLLSFKNKHEVKENMLLSTVEWLKIKKKPKTAEKITKEIFNSVRTHIPSKCILENYEDFPSKLGLPNWLSDLLITFNRHNSYDFSQYHENYEENFYPAFIRACNVGVDYSLMFHKWELMILNETISIQESNKEYFSNLIKLHKKELNGNKTNSINWTKLQVEINNDLQKINEFTNVPKEVKLKEIMLFEELNNPEKRKINHTELHNKAFIYRRYRKSFSKLIWNCERISFLSIENFINNKPYTTSSEALVDALLEKYINDNNPQDNKFEEEFRTRKWLELMGKLLIMLKEWS